MTLTDRTIDKIGVGKYAGETTKLQLKAINDVYEVYSDGVFIGKTRLDDGLWTVEIPHLEFVCYYALASVQAADLLDTIYKFRLS
jgi:hypothetical protein